jgi:hypothetical protein
MFKHVILCTSLLVFPGVSFSGEVLPIGMVARGETGAPSQTVRLPGTAFEIVVGSTAFEQGSNKIKPELLRAIAAWLSSNYGLVPIGEPPAVAFVPAETMTALRNRDSHSDEWSAIQGIADHGGAPHASSVVAIYDDLDRTIYLPAAWTGSTPTELSVLVHEMVHHLQNVAGMTFACNEEREQLAYAAQRDWLALFGRDLFTDFGTDAFTLLLRTQCIY